MHPKIGIIGMAVQLPQVDDLSEYRHVVATGRECITSLTDQELAEAEVHRSLFSPSPRLRGESRVHGGVSANGCHAKLVRARLAEGELGASQQRVRRRRSRQNRSDLVRSETSGARDSRDDAANQLLV
jgi:hypothetical protein